MLPHLPPPSVTKKTSPIQLKASSRGDPAAVLIQANPSREEAGARATWPRGIQHLALAFTRKTSLLEESRLSVLIAKNALRPRDYHRLNEVETDNLYDNIIHSMMESAFYAYITKE